MNFFLDMIPPTVTAQEHKVMVRHGRPVFYDTPRLKDARFTYEQALRLHRPDTPMEGALALEVEWYFPSKTHHEGELRVTRPDTDNLQKLLKDCMTRVGFWKDDAQAWRETVTKRWTRTKEYMKEEVDSYHEVQGDLPKDIEHCFMVGVAGMKKRSTHIWVAKDFSDKVNVDC